MIDIADDDYPFAGGQSWADAEIAEISSALLRVRAKPELGDVSNGVRDFFSLTKNAAKVRDFIESMS